MRFDTKKRDKDLSLWLMKSKLNEWMTAYLNIMTYTLTQWVYGLGRCQGRRHSDIYGGQHDPWISGTSNIKPSVINKSPLGAASK